MPLLVSASMAMRMNPAWLIEEYANMRLTLLWTMASAAPITIDRMANVYTMGFQVDA